MSQTSLAEVLAMQEAQEDKKTSKSMEKTNSENDSIPSDEDDAREPVKTPEVKPKVASTGESPFAY